MILDSDASVFNMGDTSLRVKKQAEVYRFVLKNLSELLKTGFAWTDKQSHEIFYKHVHQKIVESESENEVKLFQNFNREYIEPDSKKLGKRGRTWTSALVKNGLLSPVRTLSEVGTNYLQGALKKEDGLESLLSLDETNLLYFRQYLKLRIYSKNKIDYFYNFRFAIRFLSQHNHVPKTHFLSIVESISPKFSNKELLSIVNGYSEVKIGKLSFEQYYTRYFGSIVLDERSILDFRSALIDNNIEDFFYNGKSSETKKIYKSFVDSLIDFANNKSINSFERIRELSNDEKIKKAFGYGQRIFKIEKGETVENFINNNKSSLLDGDLLQIYKVFLSSKRYDLVGEYADMCARSFQVTGIFSFENGIATLNNSWFFEELLAYLGERFALTNIVGDKPSESYEDYEIDLNSEWYRDISLMQILGLDQNDASAITENLATKFKVSDITSLMNVLEAEQEKEFRTFVESKFPKDKVIDILHKINNRNDSEVFAEVTDSATVPTIYEYMMTIAWYYISKKKNYSLRKSFQLTLDGGLLPILHRGGGAGDIEIITPEYALLIEATLMNTSTQARGELEPVIRHSVNFNLEHNTRDIVHTIFVANELNSNLSTMFALMQLVPLDGSSEKGSVKGVSILTLTTQDIIDVLSKNIDDEMILAKIENSRMPYDDKIAQIGRDWQDSVRRELFAGC